MISDWSLKNRCETDYPDQSNQKQNWHTRSKTEQKQNSPVKIATESEGDVFLKKKICMIQGTIDSMIQKYC